MDAPAKPLLLTRIREKRMAAGLTLKQLADLLDTTPQTVQRLETEKMTVTADWLFRFADAMEIDPADLLNRSRPRTPDDRFIERVRLQAGRARRKFPSSELATVALMEEVGQLANALLEWRLGKASWACVEDEAEQVAAMAMRIANEGDPTIEEPKLARSK